MSRENKMNFEALQFFEGRNIVAQGIIARLGIEAYVGSGIIQDMVTGENKLPFSFVKTDVAR
jgi:hypothetical protein